MDVRPVLELGTNAFVGLETRGATTAEVFERLTAWRALRLPLGLVFVPVETPLALDELARSLAGAGVPGDRVALSVREDRLALPGMREALAEATQRLGVVVIVTDVGQAASEPLGSIHDRIGAVLQLAPAVWADAAADPVARARLARVTELATDLGWEVWAGEVHDAVQLAALRAAGVRAASGDAIAPWIPAEDLPGVLAPSASPVVRIPRRPPPPVRAPPPPGATPSRATAPPRGTAPPVAAGPPVAAAPRPRRRSRRGGLLVLGLLVVAAGLAYTIDRGHLPWAGESIRAVVAQAAPGRPRQGFNLTAWGRDDYNSGHARKALREAAKLGANAVAIVVTEYVDDAHATTIHAIHDKTPSMGSLRNVIGMARKMGFYVAIKPHVDTLSGHWRGDIDPADFRAFADSYRAFILRYAELAQEAGAPELVAGTELRNLTHRMATEGDGGERLVRAIRAEFHGTVGYAANWDNVDQVPFWDKVDFIGIDAYYPLSRSKSVAELVAARRPHIDQARALARRYGKPLVLTEAGYENRAGASETPWGVPSDAALDDAEQVRLLQALFTAWGNVPELQGIYLWQLYAGNPADLHPGDWSVIGKPAAKVVGEHFGAS